MKYVFLAYLFFFSLSSFSQNKQEIDSLKALLNDNQINEYQAQHYLDLSKLTENNNRDSSKIYAKTAEKMAFNINNRNLLSKALLQEGILNYKDRKDDLALLFFSRIDSIYEVDKLILEPYFMSKIYRSEVSKFTFTMEGVKQAKVYILQALALANENKDEKLVNIAKYRLAEWHGFMSQEEFTKEHLDSAKFYINSVLPYYKTKNDYDFLARSYHTLASIEIESKNLPSAEYYYKKRLQTIKKIRDSVKIGEAYQSFGSLYLKMKQPNKGLSYLDSASAVFKKSGFSTNKRKKDLLKDYAYLYESKQDYKRAFNKMYQALLLKDTIYDIENTKQAMELEKKYQTEKKQQEIKLLKSQNELAEHQKIVQRNQLLGGIALTSIAALFLFVMYRNRKKTTEKLKQLDALKSNFFSNISHEFRTPLTLISGPIQDALDDKSLSNSKRSQFEMVQRNSQRLLALVDQLLELSKIDTGHLNLHIQKGNVLQLISGLCDSFSYSAEQKEINYHKDIKTDAIEAWLDRDVIEKIVVNLLSNAIKYTPNKGSVVCNAFVTEGELHLQIKNTGKGLTPTEINSIFKRFYQTNEQNQGSGIGLALVKELIVLYKGSINVLSDDEWTTFNVELSIEKNNFNSKQFITQQNDKLNVEIPVILGSKDDVDEEFSDNEQPILLIVEDNADLRTLLKQHFEASYNVITAPNGKVGVALALEHIPDLIISDIMMPVKDGIALTNELKADERTIHIPIILLTAKADTESQFEGLDTGADDYITKPFDKKLLKLKVEKLIESRRKLQLRYSQELILTPKSIAVNNLDEKFLKKVQSVLDAKLIESTFNIEEFSKAVGMSRMQLHRKIKALTGLSASEFIRSQRLKLAAQLLKTSDINISQVGYAVGFNDHSYFDKCFKKVYKCTPTEYSKR